MSAVHLEIAGGIATLRLDNPARLNAFTPDERPMPLSLLAEGPMELAL